MNGFSYNLNVLWQQILIRICGYSLQNVDSQKVQEHTWTSNPNVGRLITPLWSGTSEKATRSTACHLSKGTLLRGTVTTFIWQRYALCCGGNYFHFIMPEEITTDYLYSSWLFVYFCYMEDLEGFFVMNFECVNYANKSPFFTFRTFMKRFTSA